MLRGFVRVRRFSLNGPQEKRSIARWSVTVALLAVLVFAFVYSRPQNLLILNGQSLEAENLFLVPPTNHFSLRPAIRDDLSGHKFEIVLTMMKREPDKVRTSGEWTRTEIGQGTQTRLT